MFMFKDRECPLKGIHGTIKREENKLFMLLIFHLGITHIYLNSQHNVSLNNSILSQGYKI